MKVLFGPAVTCGLIAGFAPCWSLCAVTPGLATTLECSPAQIVVGSPPTDPQYAVAATTVEFGGTGWRIEHRLANGTIAARNSQYTIWDESTNHSTQWKGRYARNPYLFMIGEVLDSGIPRHLIYKERLYDAARGSVLIALTQADYRVRLHGELKGDLVMTIATRFGYPLTTCGFPDGATSADFMIERDAVLFECVARPATKETEFSLRKIELIRLKQ
jgi:hypothetical protein